MWVQTFPRATVEPDPNCLMELPSVGSHGAMFFWVGQWYCQHCSSLWPKPKERKTPCQPTEILTMSTIPGLDLEISICICLSGSLLLARSTMAYPVLPAFPGLRHLYLHPCTSPMPSPQLSLLRGRGVGNLNYTWSWHGTQTSSQ